MKKQNLNQKGLQLKLNKDTISSLKAGDLKGGTNASIFKDRAGNCYVSVTTCPHYTQPYATC